MGDWEFLPLCHYGFSQSEWADTRTRFMAAAAGRRRGADGPRVLVEIRNDWGASHFMKQVRARSSRR